MEVKDLKAKVEQKGSNCTLMELKLDPLLDLQIDVQF